MKPIILLLFSCLFLTSCTIYTEKRSEALSQAVMATSDSMDVARFDLAKVYSKEAVKLAFPPKHKIQIFPITTIKKQPEIEIIQPKVSTSQISTNSTSTNSISKIISTTNVTSKIADNGRVLRVVIPKEFKDADLLIEGSNEWNDLMKTKEFAKQLEKDISNILKLKTNVDQELAKQNEMNNKMVQDLNIMQKKLVQKDLAILQRNVIIVILLGLMAIATYLRIKGIL